MNITGAGVVFSGGAGVRVLRDALLGAQAPASTWLEKEGVKVLAVPSAALAGNPVLAPARRADRFCKMSLLAAAEAWQGCVVAPERVGIIFATAFGPHATVFRFVNEILDFGESKTSPTVFSQSVHAAAAAMIASSIGVHGPTLNVADLATPFEDALALADGWLESGTCDAVLVGAADELSDVLAHVVRRKWKPPVILGEGAAFFRVERTGGLRVRVDAEASADASCCLIDPDALGGDALALRRWLPSGVPCRSHSSLWGSMRIGAAFHLAAAVLMRREKELFAEKGLLAEGKTQVVSACGTRCRTITV